MPVPAYTFLLLSGAVFTLGAIGFMVRRNPLVVFMCIELMLNAVNLAFATMSRYLVQVYRAGRQMDVDELDLMKE